MVWKYLEDILALFVKKLYQESSRASKTTAKVHKSRGTMNMSEALTEKMHTFTPREINS